jgi:GNAT superfamily N-acetyltransferase
VTSPDGDLRARPYDETTDRSWLEERIGGGYGAGHLQVRRGELIDVLLGEGLIAEREGRPAGVALWRTEPDGSTELTYLWAFESGRGTGRCLMTGMIELVPRPIWVVTTNDNVEALRFYQRLGFRLRELRLGAVDDARRDLKPSIPIEHDGIAIRDELELVLDSPGADPN